MPKDRRLNKEVTELECVSPGDTSLQSRDGAVASERKWVGWRDHAETEVKR